jgi:hypothetical protein
MPVSLAEPLKRAANASVASLGLGIDFFNEADKCEDRDVLVAIARAALKKDKKIFAKHLVKKMKDVMELGYSPVVTDWRYLHEYEEFVDTFGIENIVSVLIEKGGNVPGHEEEAGSIGKLLESVEFTHRAMFADGQTVRIGEWGRLIAQSSL